MKVSRPEDSIVAKREKPQDLAPVQLFFEYELAATRGDRRACVRLADELRCRGFFVRRLPKAARR